MSRSIALTAIILTHNEASNIRRCLECMAPVGDIVIVNSGSSDETLEIAKAMRPDLRIFNHPFKDFGDQRNWALEHTEPEYEWVLFVDADEFCTEEVLTEIADWLQEPGDHVGGFIAGKNCFLGRFLKHATMYPSYQLRLLKRGKVTFRKEGHGQREVTEGPLYYFKEGWIHEALSKGLKQWIDRHNVYSSEEVDLILKLRSEPIVWKDILSSDPILRRRSLKRLGAKAPGRPVSRFLYTYIWRGGFLDGIPGLAYCLLRFGHDIHIFAKLQERRYLGEGGESEKLKEAAGDAQPMTDSKLR